MQKIKSIPVLLVIVIVSTITFAGVAPASAQPPDVWVDDDSTGASPGEMVHGHTFSADAFTTIQHDIDALRPPRTGRIADVGGASVTTAQSLITSPLLWSHTMEDSVESVSISDDGNYLAAGGDDNKIYLFHKSNNTPLWVYTSDGGVESVSISGDGNYIAAGSGGKVYLFHSLSGTPLWISETGFRNRHVAISSDGNYIVSGNLNHKIYLFHRSNETPVWSYKTDSEGDQPVSISDDGSYIVSGSYKTVYLFHRSNNTPLWSNEIGNGISSVSISGDGNYIAAGNYRDLYFFHRSTSTPLWSYAIEWGANVGSVSASRNGNYIAAAAGKSIHFFNKSSGTPLWSHSGDGWASSVSISNGGDYVVAGFSTSMAGCGFVRFFSKEGDTPIWYSEAGDVSSVSIGNDARYVAAGTGYKKRIYLFGQMHLLETATQSGTSKFFANAGIMEDLTAIEEATLPLEGKPDLVFPHGLFSFRVTDLTLGQTLAVTIRLPSPVPTHTHTQYWKYHEPEGWYQIPMGSNDGDEVITIQLTDGGIGDDDGEANGIIVNAGGPGIYTSPIVITVDDDGPADYSKIQDAINAAIDGDTVLVIPGTYVENINFLGKAITVKSESGAENTIIDGSGIGSVVIFESGEGLDSVLDGFTITNAGGLNNRGIKCYQGSATIINNIVDNAGWGICLYKSISVIRNNVIHGNPGFDPGPFDAINSVESSPIIENNTILATDPNGNISAIDIGDSEGNLPQSFLISSNVIKGRIYVSVWSPIFTFENEISNNIIVVENLYSSAMNINIEGDATLLIANNVIHKGGGIFLQRSDDRTTIINNIITESNQGIESWSGDFEIFNNNLWNNLVNYIGIPNQTGINGNISENPMFVDADGGDYHLQPGSPCIDAGTNDVSALPETDFEGDPRIIDGNNDNIATVDMGADEYVPSYLEILLEIKTGSYPNSINLKSRGVVPVAVLTTDDFDAYDVNPNSCVFAGAEPKSWTMEDVEIDGDYDMLFHFRTQDLDLNQNSTEASLEGETVYGMRIVGTDSVNIVPKGKKYGKKGEKGR